MNIIETKNNTLIDMARKQEVSRIAKNKKVFKDGVNQRASIKQKIVCETISKVAPCEVRISEPALCKKKIDFENLDYIEHLNLLYYSKNNLFTRIFDLIVESEFPAKTAYNKDIAIGVRYEGRLKMEDVSFVSKDSSQIVTTLLSKLNDIDMISDRILNLESTDIKISYDSGSNNWSVGLATGKGSTIWSLFPPLIMLVKFTERDAIDLLELFQLITHTIKECEKMKCDVAY